jgi:N-acyl-D-amino-acid deacylase
MRLVALGSLLLLAVPARGADAPLAERVPRAIEKGLERIRAGAGAYPKHRTCFSCHHQALPLFSLTAARGRGLEVEPERLRGLVQFTLKSFAKTAQVARGQGVGGANTTVGYALAALAAAGHAADDTTAALVQFLLARQRQDGAWPGVANRPPTEGSPFTATALALHGLKHYAPGKAAPADLRRRVDLAFARGLEFLLKASPASTEDKVFRLRGLVWAGADARAVAAARSALQKEQRPDGSWGQLADLAGDAYATGTALVALRAAGLPASDPVYHKGAAYLLATQRADGAWLVQTRSRPIQIFFDNGDPGGKSQFISFVATNWAVLALLELHPRPSEPRPSEPRPLGSG